MKKTFLSLLAAAACLCLAGCKELPPTQAADGSTWNEDWVTVGSVIGVDTPEGMTLQDNKDALAANGMFFAAWSIGEGTPYTDGEASEDDEDAILYDAQVSLLLAGYASTDKAEDGAAEWLSMAEQQYQVETSSSQTCNGQTFTVITWQFPSGPYTQGASAFGVYGNYAVSIELSCQDTFEDDILECLIDFLDNCHYGA